MSLFTDSEILSAKNTDIAEFLFNRGEHLKVTGAGYLWTHNGEPYSIKNNLWFNHYQQEGGNAIDFAKAVFNLGFVDAVKLLTGISEYEIEERVKVIDESKRKPFIMPEKNENMIRSYGYLTNTRGISKDIVEKFIHCNLIYEDKKHHNVVFAGYDKEGNPKHAHMRGSSAGSKFKMTVTGSNTDYSFHWTGKDNELYIFEAPIDMLSYISLFPSDWYNHTYAAACSVTDRVLFQCLKDNPQIDTVHICFDNDGPGQTAAERILEKLAHRSIVADIIKPELKDWNEDLLANGTPTNSVEIKID